MTIGRSSYSAHAVSSVRRGLFAPRNEKMLLAYGLLALPLFYVIAVTMAPLVFNLYASLHSWQLLVGERRFIGIENYIAILTEPRWLFSLMRTVNFALISVGIQVVLGFAIALLLYSRFNNIRWLQALFLTPMMISEVAAALSWRLLLSGNNSLVNWTLQQLGLPAQLWLGPDWAFFTIVLVDVWQQTPFVILIIFAALQGVPSEQLEAAQIDGATLWERIRYVIIPAIMPALLVVLVFRTVFALRVFTTVWILTGGGPGDRTAVLGVEIYRIAFNSFDTGMGAALSIFMLLISVVVGFIFVRLMRRRALS